jgi:sterol desaturase/sphingolipid hydroxylase (fatty acid hydroxylase superfamily)
MDPTIGIAVRLAAFAAIFAVMAAWEVLAPRRGRPVGRKFRWPNNLGIVVIDAVTVRLLIPTAAVGTALIAMERGWGLFNVLGVPEWLAGMFGFLLLDLTIYVQHVTFHHVPALWRLHRMHHADLDVDVTTGVRFHPIEIALSMLIKMCAVLAFGIPAVAVVVFEIALNATSMFNHSNIAMPAKLDRVIRWLVVTPDMHRVHHSIERRETDSNFGFNLPWWDRLFGTYRPAPAAGHADMTLGIPIFRDPRELRLDRLLTQPFRNDQAVDQDGAGTRSRAGAAERRSSVGSVKPS